MLKILKIVFTILFTLAFAVTASATSSTSSQIVTDLETSISTPNGERTGTYTGEALGGVVPHGNGVFSTQNSEGIKYVYSGEFEYGAMLFNGSGSLVWENGSYETGTFVDGALEGYGSARFMSSSDGEWYTYSGYFAAGVFHGSGEIIGDNGYIAEGAFVNGNIYNGNVFSSGTWYECVNGEIQGETAERNASDIIIGFVIIGIMLVFAGAMFTLGVKMMRGAFKKLSGAANATVSADSSKVGKTAPTNETAEAAEAVETVEAVKAKLVSVKCQGCGARQKVTPGEKFYCERCGYSNR